MLAALTLAAFTFSPLVGRAAETAVTHHTVEVDGKTLHYTATAGQIMVKDKAGAPLVNFFSVAYTLDDAPHGTRPVAFLWNGGPGSSTLWLHMGSFAPMRVPVDGTAPLVPPGKLVPNDGTLLASTDLVFIDAPGTGFSRLAPKAKADDVYGIDQDARAFTSFIEAWLTAHDRWGSPKFLIGESYGTTRAANVVDRLQEDGVGVNGVVLISSALALEQLDPAPPSLDNAYIAFLPTEAAVASYHGFGPSPKPPLASYLQEVRDFARGPYATALLRGDTLDAATRAQIVSRLHRYTGLSSAYIERADLRIDPTRFEKELQRGRGLVTGRLDGRFDGYDLDRNSDSPAYDPTLDATIQDAYVSEFNRYIRDDLAYKPDDSYRPTAYDTVGSKWKMIRDAGDVGLGGSYLPNVLPDLAQALTRNPSLRVFSANGYFDIATPFFGTEINLQHLGLDPALRGHITLGYYESGHMIYLEDASRRKLRGDIERFIASAIAH
jgi:carboxypeptidase C (cathepsin A)